MLDWLLVARTRARYLPLYAPDKHARMHPSPHIQRRCGRATRMGGHWAPPAVPEPA
jgi:hypothetical protein